MTEVVWEPMGSLPLWLRQGMVDESIVVTGRTGSHYFGSTAPLGEVGFDA